MSSSPAPHSGPPYTVEELAAVTPADLASDIRTATAKVHTSARAWRSSPSWRGDKLHRKAYELVAVAGVELDSLPEPLSYRDVDHLVDVIAPILNGWWSDAPGPQRDLHDAVDELRHAAMHRTAWVRQARGMLGLPW
jgi:hypothetical protein